MGYPGGVKADGFVTPPGYQKMTALRAENLQPGMHIRFDSTGSHQVVSVEPAPTGPKTVNVTIKGLVSEQVRSFRKTKLIGVPGLASP